MATASYGGYEHSFVDRDLDKYTCNICTKVLRNPRQTGCGQVFCESCLSYWFTECGKRSCPHCRAEGGNIQDFPDKRLKREIDSLRIHCTKKKEGCQWIGELGSLKDHLESDDGCGYVKVECPKECGRKMKRKDVDKHRRNKCSLRPYQCEYCGFKDTYTNITGHGGKPDYHYKQCLEYPLDCNNYKCGKTGIKRKDMKDHDRCCQEEKVNCPNKCRSQNIKRKQIQKHLKEECVLRKYQCEHCGKKDTYQAITTEHYRTCLEFPLECPNKCGRNDIKRKDMEDHHSQCPEEPVQCPFEEAGCKKKLVRCELEQHMSADQEQHRKMIKELKISIARLAQRNTELENANDEAIDTNATLNKELLVTKQECSKLDFKSSKLQVEKSAAQQQNSKLRQDILRTKEDKSQLQKETSRLQEYISKLVEELSRLRQIHVALTEEIESERHKNEQLVQESSQIRQEASRTANENFKLQQEISRLKQQKEEIQEEMELAAYTAKEELSRLKHQKEEIQEEMELAAYTAKEELSRLKHQKEEIQEEMELAAYTAKEELSRLKQQKEEIQEEMELAAYTAKEELSRLRRIHVALTEKIESERHKNEQLEQKNDRMEQELSTKSRQNSRLQTMNSTLERELCSTEQELCCTQNWNFRLKEELEGKYKLLTVVIVAVVAFIAGVIVSVILINNKNNL